MLLRTALGQIKCVLQNTIGALSCKYGFLNHKLAISAWEHLAANTGVLTFSIFTHYKEINIAWLTVC